MLYLTGSATKQYHDLIIEKGIGLMLQPRSALEQHATNFNFWGADNGCFNSKWEEKPWMKWLERVPQERCLFAVSPDVYGDAKESLRRGLEYAPIIREMGFPVAIVAQDGAENLHWPWDEFDCVFIGGIRTPNPRNEWKETKASKLVSKARENGKWVHMGRVNTCARFTIAERMGCLSADGTMLKYGFTRNFAMLTKTLAILEKTQFMDTFETPSLPIYKMAIARNHKKESG